MFHQILFCANKKLFHPRESLYLTADHVTVVLTTGTGALKLNGGDITNNTDINKTLLDTNKLVFHPVGNGNGDPYTSFTFKVHDGTVDSDAMYTITVDITAVNDNPTASNGTVTTNEDTLFTFSVSDFGYIDIDSDPLDHVKIISKPETGTLNLNGIDIVADNSGAYTISKTDIDNNWY